MRYHKLGMTPLADNGTMVRLLGRSFVEQKPPGEAERKKRKAHIYCNM